MTAATRPTHGITDTRLYSSPLPLPPLFKPCIPNTSLVPGRLARALDGEWDSEDPRVRIPSARSLGEICRPCTVVASDRAYLSSTAEMSRKIESGSLFPSMPSSCGKAARNGFALAWNVASRMRIASSVSSARWIKRATTSGCSGMLLFVLYCGGGGGGGPSIRRVSKRVP